MRLVGGLLLRHGKVKTKREDKKITRQDETRHKTREIDRKEGQIGKLTLTDKARQDKTRQGKAIRHKTRQSHRRDMIIDGIVQNSFWCLFVFLSWMRMRGVVYQGEG